MRPGSSGNELDATVGARRLLEVCARVRQGEDVLVVTDDVGSPVAAALVAAAREMGIEPVLMVMEPRARDGQEPPGAVAAALQRSHVFFTPVGRSITHTRAVKDAIARGVRGLVLTQWHPAMLVAGGIEADFTALAPVCERLAEAFTAGRLLELVTPAGTDLRMRIDGRRGNALTCIVEPGQFSPVPTIEANVSPLEGSAVGRLVADVSVPYENIGVLEEPIELDVRDGMVQSISGGAQALLLKRILDGFADRMVYNIAELGIGLNPCARVTGCMLEDEAVAGTAHIGIGTSITLGGTVKAACHYDLVFRAPTVRIDGQTVVRDGAPVI